jgi:hypothetical protein
MARAPPRANLIDLSLFYAVVGVVPLRCAPVSPTTGMKKTHFSYVVFHHCRCSTTIYIFFTGAIFGI